MRKYLLGLLVVVLLVSISPASAGTAHFIGAWNSSGTVHPGDEIELQTPAEICAMHGESVFHWPGNPAAYLNAIVSERLCAGSECGGEVYWSQGMTAVATEGDSITITVPLVYPSGSSNLSESATCGGGYTFPGRWWVYSTDPSADFTADPLTGPVPLIVNLTDSTPGAQTWNWTVEDMSESDTWVEWQTARTVNPAQVKLIGVGNYTVTDTVINSSGSTKSLSKPHYIYVYPNNTPPIGDDGLYEITVSPASGRLTDIYSGTIGGEGNLSNITAIHWLAYYPTLEEYTSENTALYEPGQWVNTLNYVLRSGTWKGWSKTSMDFTNSKGASLPNPVTFNLTVSGTYPVGCTIYTSDGKQYFPLVNVTVGEGEGLQRIIVHAEDALTGQHASPATFNIKNMVSGVWENRSEMRPGQIDLEYPVATPLHMEAVVNYSGYDIGVLERTVANYPGGSVEYIIPMWKNQSTNVSLTTAHLAVTNNKNNQPVQGATITLSTGASQVTPSTGVCEFTVANGTPIYATVRATGFQTSNFYMYPMGASWSKNLAIVEIGLTPTPTFPGTYQPTGAPTRVDTLNKSGRQASVDQAGDIWYQNAGTLSTLIFLAVVFTILGKFGWSKRGKK